MIFCGKLVRGVEAFQESDQSGGLCGAEVISVSGHIPTTLKNLAGELVFVEAGGHGIESRATLPPFPTERVTIATLLRLND